MNNIDSKKKSVILVATAGMFAVAMLSLPTGRVFADTPGAKYQVGNTIRIVGNAWKETNGYSLVSPVIGMARLCLLNQKYTVIQFGNTILDTQMAIIMTMWQNKM